MVKYYFQSMNGSLSFVHAGTKEELQEKVKKEFGGDKAEVEAKLKASIEDAEKKLKKLEEKRKNCEYPEKEQLEDDVLIANYKKGIYDAKQELARVGDLMKADLVFFEMTPLHLDID